jgi:hypothetical protein
VHPSVTFQRYANSLLQGPWTEISILTRVTRRNIPEDAILRSHRRENLKSYALFCLSRLVSTIIRFSSTPTAPPPPPHIRYKSLYRNLTSNSSSQHCNLIQLLKYACSMCKELLFCTHEMLQVSELTESVTHNALHPIHPITINTTESYADKKYRHRQNVIK